MMITRCPACSTTFRVTPEQLKALHGKVRCGQCQHVFNALDTLLDALTGQVAPIEPIEPIEPQQEFPVMAEAAADSPDEFNENTLPPSPAVAEEIRQTQETAALLLEPGDKASKFPSWAWAFASMPALLLLLLQASIFFRVELSVLWPQAKPALQAMCKSLDCDFPLPRKGDLISIESSDLNPDQANVERLMLAATLKNRAPFAQAYPHLELTLTDTADRPLLRKVLPPSAYLPQGADIASGFLANREVAVNLALVHDNSGNALAAGYRLYLFYP